MPKRPPSVQSATSNHDRLEPKLLRAVEANSVQDVREIIEQARARQQCNDAFLSIGLVRACDKNLEDVATFLLSQNANPDYATGNKPPSLLRAAEYGHTDIAATLIEHGAQLEVHDKKGRTPLMTAAYKGHFEIVKLLLTKKANIETVDLRQRNVLHNIAADRGDTGKAAKGGSKAPRRKCGMDIVNYLLQAGINVEAEDALGRTALHWTCVTDHEDLLRILLKPRFHGGSPLAKVDPRDKRQKTPLHLAALHNREHLIKILLANGANIHAKSDGDWTALHSACNEASPDVIQCLLDAKADVNAELLTGRTPLHVAAEFGNKSAAELLLRHPRCKRGLKDRFGTTPLLVAAQHGNKDIAEMLAPWNHLGDLSRDEISASKQFDATIVDFGDFKKENRVQRRQVYDLLYGRDPKDPTKHAISTLPRNVKATNFRWIHLPANNIAWCEALLTKRFIEEGATDVEGYKALMTSFNHQHRGQRHHARFMRPMCQVVQRSAPKDDDVSLVDMAGPPMLTLQEPHLLTAVPEIMPESPRRPKAERPKTATSGAEPEQTTKAPKLPKSPIQRQDTALTTASESSNAGKQNGSPSLNKVRRQETSSTLGQSESSTSKQSKKGSQTPKSPKPKPSRKDSRNSQTDKSPMRTTLRNACNIYMFMPYLHFETDRRREEMQSALEDPGSLHLLEPARPDEVLFRAHLTKSASFLHVRRTLDQFFYHNIDTTTRDRDQVVYRFQKKHRTSSDPKIFMVDQMWMWVLGKDLVVTSFAQRWRQPRNDPLNVLDGIIEDINSTTRERVQNVYELAMTISGRCFGTFDRHRKGDDDFQFLDMFESSIGAAMDGEASLFQDFSAASQQASAWLKTHQRPNRFSRNLEAETKAHEHAAKKHEPYEYDDYQHDQEPQFVDRLLDVGQETDLLSEIKDIRDELSIIRMVLGHQEHLLPELKEAVKTIYRDERSLGQLRKLDKVFDEQEKTIGNPLKDINRMDNQASRIYESIRDLLDLKQKHANAFEARFARDQAAGTQRQGQTIMVFTVVTVIFLPLSFVAAFFTIDLDRFPRNSSGNVSLDLGYVSSYVFGIGLAISIPCIAVALSVDELGYGIKRLRGRWRDWRQRRKFGSQAGDEMETHELETVRIEQTLSVAKSMRRSLDVGWSNGRPRSRVGRKSAESPYEYGRTRATSAWDVERGRRRGQS